ncbi:NAD(P)H-hydrate dehydratase [Halobacillus shinanisalinarum]|uniref:Bifunctional NAD(P)H-hydrate repair enzyme n=1 Tax=Halobacillus shinanisalinarum TaxID=2932258 RepID=A0ABY4GUF6_9BACI|nr:NAD(P)H-hydrate dehydratase [Halobacillus shinanisalinarum]UOQ91797.1 NAD(P)H-hydrate dehydratase [Halobacillus shinanisalinarum]
MDVVTAQEMYEWDRVAIKSTGLDGRLLMENAGRAVSSDLEKKLGTHQRVIILIGAGNNGGDGFVIARTLLNRGYSVEAWQIVSDSKVEGDARYHKEIFIKSGYTLYKLEKTDDLSESLKSADVIVDAMLGIGVKGRLREPVKQVVELANEQRAFRVAVDLPTGVPADEGIVEFDAFKADYTCIIAALKMSALVEHTRVYYGEWKVCDIGLPVKKLPSPSRKVWQREGGRRVLPGRDPNSHKGSHGKALVVGGAAHMPGSIAMSAKAALRSGAGLVTIATPKSAMNAVASYVQEATFLPLAEERGVIKDSAGVDVSAYDGVAIGMGMGRGQESNNLVSHLISTVKAPLLIDADALYQLKNLVGLLRSRTYPTILTPHPGEFAHLVDQSISAIVRSPFSYSREFSKAYGVYTVLKGPATIITAPDGSQFVDLSGNAGLAKGGSGDVLSGILLAMMLQSGSITYALNNGCMLHGLTAEMLTKDAHSMVDLLATDLVEGLTQTFRTFSS